MGGAMARKICGAGHQVTLWNRSKPTAETVASECGAEAANTAAEAVKRADVVISMLATGAATEAVLLSDDVLAALRPGAVVCDMATSGVATAHALAEALTRRGTHFVDAPVSGSVVTIAAGQLLVMASGSRVGVDIAEPVLAAFAKRVAYLGEAGAGQAMKLAVNLVVHTLNSALSEALALAAASGVTPEAAYDVFADSVVAAPFVTYKRQAFLDPGAPVAMSLDLTAKDLDLITDQAAESGVRAVVADAVRAEVGAACAAGWGDRDMAALAGFLRHP